MNQHSEKIEASSKIIYTLAGLSMHQFISRDKTKIAEGKCLILQSNDLSQTGPRLFLRMNNFDFCKPINSSLFVRMLYIKSTSFLFFSEFQDDVVYALSAANSSTDLALLSEILARQGKVIDYQSPALIYQNRIRIDYHVQDLAQNEVIVNFNRTAKAAKFFGSCFGRINNAIAKKSNDINKAFHTKLEKVSEESLSESTRQKWGSLKMAASGLNDKFTDVLKPIGEKVHQLSGSFATSYYTSNNKYVKSFREFTTEAQQSINQGYLKQDEATSLRQTAQVPDNFQQMAANQQKLINEQTNPGPIL